MTSNKGTGNPQDELNRMSPAAAHAKLGDVLAELISKHNALVEASDVEGKAAFKVAPLGER